MAQVDSLKQLNPAKFIPYKNDSLLLKHTNKRKNSEKQKNENSKPQDIITKFKDRSIDMAVKRLYKKSVPV
mgnify:FL=1